MFCKPLSLGYNTLRAKSICFLLRNYSHEPKLKLRKCLIVSKLCNYEFEMLKNPDKTPSQLCSLLKERGADADSLVYYHNLHKMFVQSVNRVLQNMGVEVKVVNRLTFSDEAFAWCDLVVPVGGDGTFLLAASLSRGTKKPFMGLNSHPQRSEGRLCLDKYFSESVDEVFKRVIEGDFEWLNRSRIRTTMVGKDITSHVFKPNDLHDHFGKREKLYKLPNSCKNIFNTQSITDAQGNDVEYKVLPYLALNEVFMGENLSARVSHLTVQIGRDKLVTDTKSSGMCVSTGTGCTSWHMSINRMSSTNTTDLINIAKLFSPSVTSEYDPQEIADAYNASLTFPADDLRLCYSLRELIFGAVWPNPKGIKSRGFADYLRIKSRCLDGGLVIDGSICYPFHDGMEAILENLPEDSIRTITLN